MAQFIPQQKLSKKAKKALAKQQRGTWGALNPVTRYVPNKKHYNRKKVQKADNLHFEPFLFAHSLGVV